MSGKELVDKVEGGRVEDEEVAVEGGDVDEDDPGKVSAERAVGFAELFEFKDVLEVVQAQEAGLLLSEGLLMEESNLFGELLSPCNSKMPLSFIGCIRLGMITGSGAAPWSSVASSLKRRGRH